MLISSPNVICLTSKTSQIKKIYILYTILSMIFKFFSEFLVRKIYLSVCRRDEKLKSLSHQTETDGLRLCERP
jgi:hypothetical protein